MSRFRFPLFSPLVGSTWPIFRRVLKGNHVIPRYYLKVSITFIMVLLCSLFSWIDRIFLRDKEDGFVFKKSPLFIIGAWRSGASFLHNLLTKDPSAGYVTTYHAVFPNNLKSKWLFKNFMRIFMPKRWPAVGLRISVDFPQEDEYAMNNLTNLSFYHFFYFPSSYDSLYQQFVRFDSISDENEEAWELLYRQMIIKSLINTNGTRAVLKNLVNTGRILKLQVIFPGANFIFMVRNPIIVYLSSVNFFTQLFPTLNLEYTSPKQISSMMLDLYVRLIQDYINDKEMIGSNHIIEIRYEDFEKDPVEGIRQIYEMFELPDFEKVKPLFVKYIEDQNEHNFYAYSIEEGELEEITTKLDFAMKYWNYKVPEGLNILKPL